MKSLVNEYRQFLKDNFPGLRLGKPLFYCWKYGLRFDLQVGNNYDQEYFDEVLRRASTIFQSVFENSDQIYLVFMEYKYKRRKIRFSNFVFKQIDNLIKSEIGFTKEKQLYEPTDKFDVRNVALIKLTVDSIDYKNILKAIGNVDFPPREPRFDSFGVLTSKEVYFVNIDKKLVLHMYDDRGLDLIAADKETIKSIYTNLNDWILDYDRKQIDKVFQ